MSCYPCTTPSSDHCWLKYIQICYCFRCGFLQNQADCLQDGSNANAPPLDVKDIQLLGGSKVKAGLASLAGNPSTVNGYLKPLVDAAMKIVPAAKHVSSSIVPIRHSMNATIKETPIRRHNEQS